MQELKKLIYRLTTPSQYYQNLVPALYCGLGFILLSISSNTVLNIQQLELDRLGFLRLGYISMSLIYGSQALTCLFSSTVIARLGQSKCMVLGSASQLLWLICCVVPNLQELEKLQGVSAVEAYAAVVASSVLAGIGQGLMWVSQQKYFADCTNQQSKGFFFGLFWLAFGVSQVMGYMLAGKILLYFESQFTLFAFMTGMSLTATLIFATLPIPKKECEMVEMPAAGKEVDDELSGLTKKGEERGEEGHQNMEYDTIILAKSGIILHNDFHSIIKLLRSPRMLDLLPQILWCGLSMGYYSAVLFTMVLESISYEPLPSKLHKGMHIMVVHGLGEVVGSQLMGQVIDRLGNKISTLLILLLISLQTFFIFMFIQSQEYNNVTFVMAFIWGLQDSCANTHISEILAFEFENNVECFSASMIVQSVGVMVVSGIDVFISNKEQLFFFNLCIGIAGIIMCSKTLNFDYRKEEKQI